MVHGPSGVGKSRLLAGLVAEWLLRRPGSAVAHLEAEAFAAACAEAAGQARAAGPSSATGSAASTCSCSRTSTPWSGAPLALDELAHTLDALDEAGAAVAVSARTAPGPVVARLAGAAGQPPGRGPGGPDRPARAGLAPAVRARPRPGARPGALGRGRRAAGRGRRRLPDPRRLARPAGPEPAASGGDAPAARLAAVVAALLAEEAELAAAGLTIEQVARAVAARFGVRLRDLRGPRRRPSVVEARHLAMHLARLLTGLSFAAIGAYFGGRDPATVRHACKAAAERLAADPALAAAAAALRRRWQTGEPGDADPNP